MPIRFYCPFCEQLLGISSRKAGAVITCPRCRGEVGVPGVAGPGRAPPPLPGSGIPVVAATETPELILSPSQVAVLTVALILLVGVAFLAGLLVGLVR